MFHDFDTKFRTVASGPTIAAALVAAGLLAGCIIQDPGYREPPPVYREPPHEYVPPPDAYGSASENTYGSVSQNTYGSVSENYGSSGESEPAAAGFDVNVRVTEAPPPLPIYDQPPCPEPGYLWTPGYWGYSGEGYFWVPGTWLYPPQVGVLWTPGYWGWNEGVFLFHVGYWGEHVGFYGGVNYGGGYIGHGYEGGRWEHDRFAYNTAVNNVNTTIIHNTYNQTVINNNVSVNNVSYNGGRGGLNAAPSRQEVMVAREGHVPPPALQLRHVTEAAQNPAMLARYNNGRPSIAATPRAAVFDAPNVVGARGAVPFQRAIQPQKPQLQVQQPQQPRDYYVKCRRRVSH